MTQMAPRRALPPKPQRAAPGRVFDSDGSSSDDEESGADDDREEADGRGEGEDGDYGEDERADAAAEGGGRLDKDENWFGKGQVGLHGQLDPEHDPDRTDPLTLGDAFGSRILRDHLLIGAMESSLLDAFTPRQRGLVCALALAVTALLTCVLVEQPEMSPELAVVGSTLASFALSVVLQHVYEAYQPRVRTVVPYLDERTGQYGLAKLSEADGIAADIKELAAEQKRKVTLEESRRRKRLQERARRRACQVSLFSLVLTGAIGGVGYLGYLAGLRTLDSGEAEPVFWCALLSLIGQFVVLHTLKVLFSSLMAVMTDRRRRKRLERSRRVGVHSESAAEALAAKLGKPQLKPPPPPPKSSPGDASDAEQPAADNSGEDEDDREDEDENEAAAPKNKPPPPPRRADQQAKLQAAADGQKETVPETPPPSQAPTATAEASALAAPVTPVTVASAAALAAPTPSTAATALPPLATPARLPPDTPQPSIPAVGNPAAATPVTPAPAPASVPRPGRAPASIPRPVRKAPASVPRPPKR